MKIRKVRSFLIISWLALGFLTMIPHADAEEKGGEKGEAGYVTLDPFTSNLADTDNQRYLQISLSIKGTSPEAAENVKSLMPMVRHAVLMTLCAKKSDDLLSTKGKTDLMEDLKNSINQTLQLSKERSITEVFFTNFIVQ
jgi:flagellar basal body-associated protein FliL